MSVCRGELTAVRIPNGKDTLPGICDALWHVRRYSAGRLGSSLTLTLPPARVQSLSKLGRQLCASVPKAYEAIDAWLWLCQFEAALNMSLLARVQVFDDKWGLYLMALQAVDIRS
jgi:hypothetical protein